MWRGTVPAEGVVLEREWAARALELWAPATRLESLDDGRVLLTFAGPQNLRADRAPGAVIVRAGAGWADHPAAEPADAGTVAVLVGGQTATSRITGPIDPSELVDLTGWVVSVAQRVVDVIAEPSVPTAPSTAPEPPPIDSRAALGGMSPPDDATRRMWREVTEDANAGRAASARPKATARPEAVGQPRSPGRLRAWLDARLASSPGARRRHERYLEELDELFQRGDLEEALRRAIPLGGTPGAPTPSVPGRRADLAIDLKRSGASRLVDVPVNMQRHLRDSYQAAHEQLDRAGRTKEAAFVLADLLDDTPGACAYLERKGELHLAASLADARSADHAMTIRLWWKAGDRRRAITLARRHRSYAGAVARLERSGEADEARSLRRAWASDLAAAGDVVGTVDALEGCDDETSAAVRDRVMRIGLAGAGPTRARMVARGLRTGHPGAVESLGSLLADDVVDERRLVAEELTSRAGEIAEPGALRPLVRQLLSDDGQTRSVRRLASMAQDSVLEADLPTEVRQPDPPPELLEVHLDDSDRGLVPVRDVRMLADGTLLAVLEGIGVRMLRPDGRRIADLDLAVDFLVPADAGGRALAVRRLDPGAVALWEIDVWERRSRPLGELAATAWSTSYDGSAWFIAHGDTLVMLDLIEGGPSALWAQAALGGPVVAIARSAASLAVAAAVDYADEAGRLVTDCFVFDLPALTGREHRRQVLIPGRDLLPNGATIDDAVASDDDHVLVAPLDGGRVEVWSRGQRVQRAALHVAPDTAFTATIDHGNLVYGDQRGRIERLDLRARVRLPAVRTTT